MPRTRRWLVLGCLGDPPDRDGRPSQGVEKSDKSAKSSKKARRSRPRHSASLRQFGSASRPSPPLDRCPSCSTG